jgi:hypothetical protein
MSEALFNSLTKEVFTEAKVVTYTWKILESESFQEEHPRLYLSSQIKFFLRVVELSTSKSMKMHAAVCMFDFVRRNFEQIKQHMPTILPTLEAKAEEMMQDSDESCVGCELYDIAENILILCKPPHSVTPCKCSCSNSSSNAAPQKEEAPGAPRKIPHPKMEYTEETLAPAHEEEKLEVAKELFPAPSVVAEERQTKKGIVYRAVSKGGMKSSVVCLEDNGSLLEIRFGEKTGYALEKVGRRVYESYDAWQDELNWF